jgi:hypothetical protein
MAWFGSYYKYGSYPAISHTNIETPTMEWSELTGLRLKKIISGGRTVVQCSLKQRDSFWMVLGLGWDYLATEGFISLARLTKS